jgi:hypothetical protein
MSRENTYIQLIKKYNPTNIAEVGVWNAKLSLLALNECNNITQYHLIDPLQEDTNNFIYDSTNSDFPSIMNNNRYICNMGEETKNQQELDQMYDSILSRISHFPSANFIREESIVAANKFLDKSLDMVFIDAIHLYENVKEDIKTWLPKVKSGGIISGDDYTDHFPGVKQAVQEYFKNEFSVENGIWYVIKK